MNDLLSLFVLSFVSLFVTVDPVGLIPTFAALTPGHKEHDRSKIVRTTSIATFVILMLFFIFGQWIFKFFQITLPAFQIAGGVILMIIALDMLQAKTIEIQQSDEEITAGIQKAEVALTPLAIPMLAGPGSITPVLFWTAIFMLPFSVLGGLKEGGSRNTIAYTTYFLLAGIAVAPLGRLQVRTRLQWLAVLCIIVQAAALPYELLLKPAEEDFAKTAESKILADPGEIYFPRLPLLHLWYENRIYHDTIGLRDRVWAGMDPSEKRLLAHIPENAKAIAFYEHDSDDMDLFRGVLTEFEGNFISDPSLPNFRIYPRKSSPDL